MHFNISTVKALVAVVDFYFDHHEWIAVFVQVGHEVAHATLFKPGGIADVVNMAQGVSFAKAWSDRFDLGYWAVCMFCGHVESSALLYFYRFGYQVILPFNGLAEFVDLGLFLRS